MKNGKSKTGSISKEKEVAVAFLEGYLTCAEENEIPLRSVCLRLGEVLLSTWKRTGKQMSELRTYSKRNTSKRKAMESMEDDGNTYRRAQAKSKRKMTWWKKLSKAEKAVIIAKRVAGSKKTKDAKKKEAA